MLFLYLCKVFELNVALLLLCFFFFKQKTAYEMRISDWSSDVCSSDLPKVVPTGTGAGKRAGLTAFAQERERRRGAAELPAARGTPPPKNGGESNDLPRKSLMDASGFEPWSGSRSEERRVGKECVRTGRYRGSQDPSKKNIKNQQ